MQLARDIEMYGEILIYNIDMGKWHVLDLVCKSDSGVVVGRCS